MDSGADEDANDEGDGFVDRKEFKKFIVGHANIEHEHCTISADDIDDILDEVFAGKDTRGINEEEFLAFLLSLCE